MMANYKIKKGDQVIVISGKEKGKKGEIMKIMTGVIDSVCLGCATIDDLGKQSCDSLIMGLDGIVANDIGDVTIHAVTISTMSITTRDDDMYHSKKSPSLLFFAIFMYVWLGICVHCLPAIFLRVVF